MAKLVDARGGGYLRNILRERAIFFTLDGEKLLDIYWPEGIPESFEELEIPLSIATTDFFRREGVTFDAGPLRPAVGASLGDSGCGQADTGMRGEP